MSLTEVLLTQAEIIKKIGCCRPSSSYNSGHCHNISQPEGVAENDIEAVKWLTLAANEKNSGALYFLGECYFHGRGVIEDEGYGIKLITEAASLGNEDALGVLTEIGIPLPEVEIIDENVYPLGDELTTLARIA